MLLESGSRNSSASTACVSDLMELGGSVSAGNTREKKTGGVQNGLQRRRRVDARDDHGPWASPFKRARVYSGV